MTAAQCLQLSALHISKLIGHHPGGPAVSAGLAVMEAQQAESEQQLVKMVWYALQALSYHDQLGTLQQPSTMLRDASRINLMRVIETP